MTPVPQHLIATASEAIAALLVGDNLNGTSAVEALNHHEREILARAARSLVDLTR
jgi:hypothetical protein